MECHSSTQKEELICTSPGANPCPVSYYTAQTIDDFFQCSTLRENQFVSEQQRREGALRGWGLSVALWISGVCYTFLGRWWCQCVGPACKLNGETEKCIIDQGDAKVSRSQHRIRFRYRVINPQAWIKAKELICTLSFPVALLHSVFKCLLHSELRKIGRLLIGKTSARHQRES